MLDRISNLIKIIDDTRSQLDRQDAENACLGINQLFTLIPDHLIAIGTRMNMLNSKILMMENETKLFLMYTHQRKNICSQGVGGEYLDLGETRQKLKSMKKMLEKQSKLIKKSDTNYNNSYRYYYEF